MRPVPAIARLFAAMLRDRRGASAVEYGLIAALIVIAMFTGLRGVADATITVWNYVSREVIAKA